MNETSFDLTVIVPVYNQVHLTKRCFASLLSGASASHEIVVIDNHSTDETPRYLQGFKRQAEEKGWHVQIITNTENRGVGAAWNQALAVARGSYVAIVNNDTWLMPAWDEVLLRRIRELNAAMIGSYYDEESFDEKLTPLKAQQWIRKNRGKFNKNWSSILMLFDRKMFESTGLFDERFFVSYEDRDMRERMERLKLPYFTVGDCFIWHHSKGTRDAVKLPQGYEKESLEKFINKWGFDPRPLENTKTLRWKRKWARFKNRLGLF